MAATTLVREAMHRASLILNDYRTTQFVRWESNELAHWFNDAGRALAKYLPYTCSRVDAIKLVPGTRQSIEVVPAASIVPGDGSTAVERHGIRLMSAPTRNMGSTGIAPGRAIRSVSRESLDAGNPTWHTETGAFVREVVYDPQTPKVFYVWPGVPSDRSVWIEVPWLPVPLEIPVTGDYSFGGSNNTVLPIDDQNIDDAVNYVVARALQKDAEEAGSADVGAQFATMFTASINMQAVAAGLPNPNLRRLPFAQQEA